MGLSSGLYFILTVVLILYHALRTFRAGLPNTGITQIFRARTSTWSKNTGIIDVFEALHNVHDQVPAKNAGCNI